MRTSALVARTAAELGSVAEARTLVAHALGTDPTGLLLAADPTAAQTDAVAALVARRRAGEPVQHLTGEAWFRTVRVEVGPGVFVPRPETEVMTGWALERLAEVRAAGTRRGSSSCAPARARSASPCTPRRGPWTLTPSRSATRRSVTCAAIWPAPASTSSTPTWPTR